MLLSIIAGIGGGVARDIILNQIPSALTNPWYIILSTIMAIVALTISYRTGQKLKAGLLDYVAAFSLPWYAAVGVDKALAVGLPVLTAVIIGIIGPTTGRFIVDVTSGVTPKHFVKGEFYVTTAILTSIIYYVCFVAGLSIWPATLISVAVGFSFRASALRWRWEEKEPWEPKVSTQGSN